MFFAPGCFLRQIFVMTTTEERSISVAFDHDKKNDIVVLGQMLCSVKTVLILLAGYSDVL